METILLERDKLYIQERRDYWWSKHNFVKTVKPLNIKGKLYEKWAYLNKFKGNEWEKKKKRKDD